MAEGQKYDEGKVRMSLVPHNIVETMHVTSNGVSSKSEGRLYLLILSGILNFDGVDRQAVLDNTSELFTKLSISLGFDNSFDITYAMAELYEYGANMHFKDSWRSVEPLRWVDALGRHLRGEGADKESGFDHGLHAMWNCISIYWNTANCVRF